MFAYIFMIRFPDEERERPSPRFLKPEECQFIIDRLEHDRGDVEVEEFNLVKYLKSALDLEVWGFAFIFLSVTGPSYSLLDCSDLIPSCSTTVSYAFACEYLRLVKEI